MPQPTVLIADDVLMMRELLHNTLMRLDCEVIGHVSDGEEALNQIRLCSPDIVFLDIDMPVKDGLQTLEEISREGLKVFPVICSGLSTFENVKAAMDLGAKGFIVKPYSTGKVKQMVDKFLAERDGL